ncbi:MAG: hypothetical protein M0R70_12670 [Nitrospirae bacterium]|nr:hypothetical protein [Nitrospirota bacterium]
MKWIPFFKTGKHIAANKSEFDATSEKLDKILEMNKGREMPIAIGHPKTSSPAWGWVDELKRVGDVLYARPKMLVAEFEAMVRKGMFKNISVSMNPDLTIRHIGFLGATPPAIEGLQAEFNADENALVVEFSMSEAYALNDVGAIFQRLRDWMIEKFDLATADTVISQWQIDNLKTVAPDDAAPAQTAYSKPEGGDTMPKTVQELEAELAAEKAKTAEFSKSTEKVTQLETELKTERKKNQVAEFSAFCASDEMKKKISPAMKPMVLDFMQLLAGTETYEFSAPEGKKENKAPVEAFKEFAKAFLPDIITTEELATKGKASDTGDIKTKREAAEMEFSKANPGMTYAQVVLAVSKDKPELYSER